MTDNNDFSSNLFSCIRQQTINDSLASRNFTGQIVRVLLLRKGVNWQPATNSF